LALERRVGDQYDHHLFTPTNKQEEEEEEEEQTKGSEKRGVRV